MAVDRNTQVVGVGPDISAGTFSQVLQSANSPAAGEAGQAYQAIVAEKVSPAFCLSVFQHESRYATDPASMVVKHSTKNPGNCRTSRTGAGQVIPTERGNFVKYPDWTSGFKDLARRLVDPGFAYAMSGAKTIGQILPIWAPASDGNNPDGYINAVVNSMNSLGAGNSNMVVQAPKPNNIQWVGSPNHWDGRDGNQVIAICDHIMQGTMESTRGWFNNPDSQVSAHFGVAEDGRIHQYVSLENAAWANGIAENIDQGIPWLVSAVANKVNENNLTVSIEHEGDTGDVMPEAQYQSTLALHRWLIGLYGVPVDRDHIIGHYQISGRQKANCPGTGFPWQRLMADLATDNAASTGAGGSTPTGPALPPGFVWDTSGHNVPGAIIDSSTGNLILQPFADYWLSNGAVEKFGRPLEYGAHGEAGQPGSVVTEFKYAHMYVDQQTKKVVAQMKDRNNPAGFDVGPGMMATARKLGYEMLTNEQFFIADPAKPQPGLGKLSLAWASDPASAGQVHIFMAIEHPEQKQPDGTIPWEVKVVKEEQI